MNYCRASIFIVDFNFVDAVTCFKFLRFLPTPECLKSGNESNTSHSKSSLHECVVKLGEPER